MTIRKIVPAFTVAALSLLPGKDIAAQAKPYDVPQTETAPLRIDRTPTPLNGGGIEVHFSDDSIIRIVPVTELVETATGKLESRVALNYRHYNNPSHPYNEALPFAGGEVGHIVKDEKTGEYVIKANGPVSARYPLAIDMKTGSQLFLIMKLLNLGDIKKGLEESLPPDLRQDREKVKGALDSFEKD